jgi:hypothetical protein
MGNERRRMAGMGSASDGQFSMSELLKGTSTLCSFKKIQQQIWNQNRFICLKCGDQGLECGPLAACKPSMCKVLGLIPNTVKKKVRTVFACD